MKSTMLQSANWLPARRMDCVGTFAHAEPLERRWMLAAVTVTSTGDTIASDGFVTLREAITAINNGADTSDVVADVSTEPYSTNDTINFAIGGSGAQTIGLTSDLPLINKPLTLNGYSQPGASPNTLADGDDAVLLIEIDGNTYSSIQIGQFADGTAVRGLAIYDSLFGVDVSSADCVIAGNFIGLRADGTTGTASEATQVGVTTDRAGTVIGGTDPADRNVIANSDLGVRLNTNPSPSPSGGGRVQGNFIGTDRTGKLDRGNFEAGVFIVSDDNLIGGTAAGARNVIAATGTGSAGVHAGVQISSGTGNHVQGNYIGTDVTGAADLGNAVNGVRIDRAPGNLIGGTDAGAGNVVSGNGSYGIEVDFNTSVGNVIQGNRIGTNAAGDAALANDAYGVKLAGPNSLLGGTDAGAGNLISGNKSGGVLVGPGGVVTDMSGDGSVIQGNLIGLDATGTSAVPNGGPGVVASYFAGSFTIGGAVAAARNVISGNANSGLVLSRSRPTVLGNYIGTDITGEVAVPNVGVGVEASSGATLTLGGGNPGEGNVIAANTGHGVWLQSSDSIVQGNRIGLSPTGAPLGNGGHGVRSDAPDNIIGGANDALGNVIAYNTFAGVGVVDTDGANTVRHNSIFSNVGLGIDLLGNGITANDPGDADTGPNALQNFPVLTSAVNNNSGGTVITGTINSTPNTTLIIDFYTDTNAAAEGRTFVGSKLVTTDGSGNASTTITVPALTPGLFVTSTASTIATDPYDNTSEFSQPVQVAAAPPQTPPTAIGYTNLRATKTKAGKYAFTGVVASFTSTVFTSANDFKSKINWGDGTTSAGQIVWNSSTNRWDVIGSHQYAKKGTYNLLITIVDSNGKTATATSKLTAA